VLGAALLVGLGAQSAGAVPIAPFELWVVFHENHTITVTFDDGTPVGSLSGAVPAIAPGSYTLHFEDSVGVEGPDFDLRGPGVSLQEDLFFGEAPSATHRVTFLPGSTYTWRNVEQPNTIFSFSTSSGSVSTPSTGGGSPTPAASGTKTSTSKDIVGSQHVAFRGTLSGNVSTTGKLALKYLGKTVGSLKTGSYKVSVLDETSKAAFYIQRLGKAATRVSGASFVGKRTVTLTLSAGQWFFYSTPGKKSYFIVHS
jgi:hypothetical protein